MARPAMLQMLQRGKALCGKIFPDFVDTWNYTVNRCDNLAGDFDTDPQGGHLEVDNTDPEHPVIRLRNADTLGGGSSVLPGCFDLDDDRAKMVRCYYRVEQFIFAVDDVDLSGDGLYALKIPFDNPGGGSVEVYPGGVTAFNAAAAAMTDSYVPLYLVSTDSDGTTRTFVDFRTIPTAQEWALTYSAPSETSEA